MKPKYWWVKERHNPQLGVYYVPLGRMTMRDAMRSYNPKYGLNILHKFESEHEYEAKLKELRKSGEKVH